MKFKNWMCQRKLHRSGLDLLLFFEVFPSSAIVFIVIFSTGVHKIRDLLEIFYPNWILQTFEEIQRACVPRVLYLKSSVYFNSIFNTVIKTTFLLQIGALNFLNEQIKLVFL